MIACHITSVHARYDIRILEKECTYLARTGIETYLIVNDDLPDEIKNGVHIISTGFCPRNRVERLAKTTWILLKIALGINADVYHLHDPELLRLAIYLKRSGRKVVFDSHEFTAMQIYTKSYIPALLRWPLSKVYRLYETVIIKKLDGLVIPCLYKGRDYFSNINIPKAMVGNYPILDNDILKRSSKPSDDIERKMCYIGSITASRGAIHMVKAAAIARVKLVLIGDIEPGFQDELQKMPEYNEWVEYKGRLAHSVALSELSGCMVGLSLLQREGQYPCIDNLPTKLYEYMMMGIPAVVSDFPYYMKVLQRFCFGIAVDPSDDEAIARSIIKIVDDKETRRKMADEGKRAITEEMNWNMDFIKLQKLYHDICEEQ